MAYFSPSISLKYPSSDLQCNNLITSLILLTIVFKQSNFINSILFTQTKFPLDILPYNKLFKPVRQKSELAVKK